MSVVITADEIHLFSASKVTDVRASTSDATLPSFSQARLAVFYARFDRSPLLRLAGKVGGEIMASASL